MEIQRCGHQLQPASMNCPELLEPNARHLIDSAWALVAHEKNFAASMQSWGCFIRTTPLPGKACKPGLSTTPGWDGRWIVPTPTRSSRNPGEGMTTFTSNPANEIAPLLRGLTFDGQKGLFVHQTTGRQPSLLLPSLKEGSSVEETAFFGSACFQPIQKNADSIPRLSPSRAWICIRTGHQL